MRRSDLRPFRTRASSSLQSGLFREMKLLILEVP